MPCDSSLKFSIVQSVILYTCPAAGFINSLPCESFTEFTVITSSPISTLSPILNVCCCFVSVGSVVAFFGSVVSPQPHKIIVNIIQRANSKEIL
jgi:hypothetical protein